MRTRTATLAGPLALLVLAAPATAHPGHLDPAGPGSAAGGGADIAAGLIHPFGGADHLLAMLAVGLLAAKLGGRCRWLLPALFVAGMIAGGAVASAFGPPQAVSGVEQAIAATVVALGLMLVFAGRLSPAFAMAAIPAFALFHGYAHLVEATAHAALGYGAGMIIGSALLHAAGLGVGLLVAGSGRPAAWAWRVGGGAVAGSGILLLADAL